MQAERQILPGQEIATGNREVYDPVAILAFGDMYDSILVTHTEWCQQQCTKQTGDHDHRADAEAQGSDCSKHVAAIPGATEPRQGGAEDFQCHDLFRPSTGLRCKGNATVRALQPGRGNDRFSGLTGNPQRR